MASKSEEKKVDEYVKQFIAADRNRRSMNRAGGGNIRHIARKFVGIKDTRGAKIVTTKRLDKMFERKTGTYRQAG